MRDKIREAASVNQTIAIVAFCTDTQTARMQIRHDYTFQVIRIGVIYKVCHVLMHQ